MVILERHIQTIAAGKWDAYLAWEKQWDAIEQRIGGVPPKRRYSALVGEYHGTVVWEREWKDLATLQATYEKYGAEPECKELVKPERNPVASERAEYWNVVEL